jgi:very-short-patch-repair endonuclease
MVVECDGHDFHERIEDDQARTRGLTPTKEQARRDRERDRLLQSFGFLVYRYTGREIWEDVFTCATQALDSLRSSVVTALDEHR